MDHPHTLRAMYIELLSQEGRHGPVGSKWGHSTSSDLQQHRLHPLPCHLIAALHHNCADACSAIFL
eukprot:27170-Heterocapsa_arctica.AAC.1